jgi:ketosteroid isomerase-like protein
MATDNAPRAADSMGHGPHHGRQTHGDPPERRAVLQLAQALQDAWNRNDAAGYASLFTEDASFIAWNGAHGHGRRAIEDAHRPLFAGPLASSRMVLLKCGANTGVEGPGGEGPESLRFVRDDVAIMVMSGAVTLADQSVTGPDHESVQTFVLIKDDDQWRVTAFHNTRRQVES